MALTRLSEQQVVELEEECEAAMVNNLLVALDSDSSIQPTVNTGNLYTLGNVLTSWIVKRN